MTRRLRLPFVALILASAALSLSGCGHEEKAASIEAALIEDVEPIPGVITVDPHVNANTSGTFITLSVTADSNDEDEIKRVAREALKVILNDPRIGHGSFSMGVFSPDKTINIGPSDVGCQGTGTTDSLRGCVL
ncbi:hypothetical protein J2Y66_003785 [Paenarthrobacter nitroguajacolicus]|uniref:hypothetical protein n=1 Tax=Paenarthrobacter nitroguajacolicus TaxID=211146 RepID=UPI002864EF41|nr:hypothetical protein [Paenarthrobacter nitroguajacolicus]MDR6989270.1 hypothetical protein [Paenarthrobacter nitroguajacolicus]